MFLLSPAISASDDISKSATHLIALIAVTHPTCEELTDTFTTCDYQPRKYLPKVKRRSNSVSRVHGYHGGSLQEDCLPQVPVSLVAREAWLPVDLASSPRRAEAPRGLPHASPSGASDGSAEDWVVAMPGTDDHPGFAVRRSRPRSLSLLNLFPACAFVLPQTDWSSQFTLSMAAESPALHRLRASVVVWPGGLPGMIFPQ